MIIPDDYPKLEGNFVAFFTSKVPKSEVKADTVFTFHCTIPAFDDEACLESFRTIPFETLTVITISNGEFPEGVMIYEQESMAVKH